MYLRSLRTRFILAYAGLIILGFGMLAILAGRQLARTAHEDYERQIENKVLLISRVLEEPLLRYFNGDLTTDELNEIVEVYEDQADAQLQLFLADEPIRDERGGSPPEGKSLVLYPEWNEYAEIVSAGNHHSTVEQRPDSEGIESIYIAAPIMSRGGLLGYVQLWEPSSRLSNAINERWAGLAIGVSFVTLAALVVSFWLLNSLIKPLRVLHDSAIQLSQGNLAHRVPSFSTDELDRVAVAFNYMANQVQAMLEAQRAFASNTSHELRTPLTAMRLRTEALRYDVTLEMETRNQYIQELDDELIRMTRLIEDLILLSRFDSGRAEIGIEHIDFLGFAENLTGQLRSQAVEKNIDLRFVPSEDGTNRPLVRANLTHLNVVFRNLLDNAIKYTPPGGVVGWRIHTSGQWVISSIQDSGQGISTEQLPHVFDRFYRGDKAHSRQIPGTGLGLSLVKAIVDAYDGKIEVTSLGLEKGTTVTVYWNLFAPSP